MKNDLFLKACRREPVERTPVWLMRQAGRYLPEYRTIRSKIDFLTLCKTPELATQVTLQPVDILDVDAAIIFSDILVLSEAMGMKLNFDEENGGPRFEEPLRSESAINRLRIPIAEGELGFVMNAIRLTRNELNGRVPLIGFSGSPWTLAAYMVEGRGTKDFRHAKELVYSCPDLMHSLLQKTTLSVIEYLKGQILAGAQAIQIFDTWGGILPPDYFLRFSLDYIIKIIQALQSTNVSIILFCKGASHSLGQIANSGAHVVGLDWTTDIADARHCIGGKVALQGNLDPCILYAPQENIRAEVGNILEKYGTGAGHIFNLGHGIFPDVPVEHVKACVRFVKEESIQYHI